MPLPSLAGGQVFVPTIKAKTAAYSVLATESGTFFTTRGATASITFTLPAVTDLPIGTNYTFYSVSAYGLVVASNGSSDNIIALNDVAADTVTCTTTSRIIGAAVQVIWDGVKWLSLNISSGPTYAVA